MSSSRYTQLYAVPKDSFDKYIYYRMNNFPNVKNLKVEQLNFNEAKKLNTYQQHTTPRSNLGEHKQLNVNTRISNLPNTNAHVIPKNNMEDMGQRLGGNTNNSFRNSDNRNSGHGLGDNSNNFFANDDPNQRDMSVDKDRESDTNVSNISNQQYEQSNINQTDIDRLRDLQANAAWNMNTIKQSQSTYNQPSHEKDISEIFDQTAIPQHKNSFDSTLTNSQLQPNPDKVRPYEEPSIFHTSSRKKRNSPKTSTPDQALKRMQQSLKNLSTHNKPVKKDFIGNNKAAIKKLNQTNQTNTQNPQSKKGRNPRVPNLNNSKPVATHTRSKLKVSDGVGATRASFNSSATKRQKDIVDRSDKLQKSAMH